MHKPKSLRAIEEKMDSTDESSLRHKVLEGAKTFKTSWIELGQMLYSVWKDKMYREWGYTTFDAYTAKEIGIKKQTAVKLLRSYYFLEKEEPRCLTEEYVKEVGPANVPTYEAVDVLRLASQKKDIDKGDYARLRANVIEKGKDAREVKKDLTQLIREREELEPEEALKRKRAALIRRFVGILRAIKEEVRISKALPQQFVKDAEKLIHELEAHLG
ncbi:MAG: hypothetical protein PHS37_06310 [Candidatus Omnitrophica bacterium]|nr:hypothetical protein [Candidatus Omnitrophota bacterium]